MPMRSMVIYGYQIAAGPSVGVSLNRHPRHFPALLVGHTDREALIVLALSRKLAGDDRRIGHRVLEGGEASAFLVPERAVDADDMEKVPGHRPPTGNFWP